MGVFHVPQNEIDLIPCKLHANQKFINYYHSQITRKEPFTGWTKNSNIYLSLKSDWARHEKKSHIHITWIGLSGKTSLIIVDFCHVLCAVLQTAYIFGRQQDVHYEMMRWMMNIGLMGFHSRTLISFARNACLLSNKWR